MTQMQFASYYNINHLSMNLNSCCKCFFYLSFPFFCIWISVLLALWILSVKLHHPRYISFFSYTILLFFFLFCFSLSLSLLPFSSLFFCLSHSSSFLSVCHHSGCIHMSGSGDFCVHEGVLLFRLRVHYN